MHQSQELTLATRETIIQQGSLLEDCLLLAFIKSVGHEVNAATNCPFLFMLAPLL
jgi:hypothetical protein